MAWKFSLAFSSRLKWQPVYGLSQSNLVVWLCISVWIICVLLALCLYKYLKPNFQWHPFHCRCFLTIKCANVLLYYSCACVAGWASTLLSSSSSFLSPFCRVFTIIYLQQTTFLCCICSVFTVCSTCNVMFRPWNMFCTFTLVLTCTFLVCYHGLWCPVYC